LGRDETAHGGTALPGQTVPDYQQRSAQVPHQVLQKLDDLRRLDRPGKQFGVEVPPRDPGPDRKRLPVEVEVEHRRLSTRRPSAHAVGPFAQSAFVDEDNGWASNFGVFLSSGNMKCPSMSLYYVMLFSSRSEPTSIFSMWTEFLGRTAMPKPLELMQRGGRLSGVPARGAQRRKSQWESSS